MRPDLEKTKKTRKRTPRGESGALATVYEKDKITLRVCSARGGPGEKSVARLTAEEQQGRHCTTEKIHEFRHTGDRARWNRQARKTERNK